MKPVKIAFTKKYFPEQYHGEDYFIEYELEEGDKLCDAFKKAKEDTFQCFKNNNPQIHFNDEVIQVNNETPPPNGFAVEYKKKEAEKINKGTIEEQIDKDFNLIDEIKKSKSPLFLKIFEGMCKTDEEKSAYRKRMDEFERKELKKAKLQTQ